MSIDPAAIVVLPVAVLSVVVHEVAHGVMASWRGDPTAREHGRLTLNPLPHLDPVGSLLLPGLLVVLHAPFVFGWAKPVPIDWARLKSPRNDPVWVALAGPASNALLALLFAALARVALVTGFLAPLRVMGIAGVVWNCALGLFNLLPIPPLDGSWVLMRFLPLRHIIALRQFRLLGLALIMVVLASPGISKAVIGTPLDLAVGACLELFGVPRGPGTP